MEAVPGSESWFVRHTRQAKKVYLGLMKVMQRRNDRDKAALKEAQEKLVRITGETIAGGREIQAEMDLLQERSLLGTG